MTTIAQLPPAASVGAGDLLPLSQAGLLYSVTVSQLTADLQPGISIATGDLLGRNSIGAGAPEAVVVGTGLALSAGALAATGADHAGFPVLASLALSDDIVISADGAPGLLPVQALWGLFTAGSGLAIENGVISVTASSVAGTAGPQGPAGAGLVYTTASGMNGPTVATAGAYSIDVELALDNLSDSSAVLTCDVKGVPTATPQTPVPEFAQSYDVGAGSGLPEGPVNVFTLSGIATLNQKTSLTMLCYDAAGDAVQAQSALWYVAPLQTG